MSSTFANTVLQLGLATICLAGAPAWAAERAPAAGSPGAVAPAWAAVGRAASDPLDRRVRLLTNRLQLDEQQQARLRKLLELQRERIRQVWADHSMSGADHLAATRAIVDGTGDHIRAMLNPEQRNRYYVSMPQRDPAHSEHADLERWMRLTTPSAARAPGSSR